MSQSQSPLLDKWDHMVLFYIKRDSNPNSEGIKKIWAERCALHVEHVELVYVFHHFFELVNKLELPNKSYFFSEVMNRASPANLWRVSHWISDLTEEENNRIKKWIWEPVEIKMTESRYWEIMLGSILSELTFLEHRYLPGFKDYADKRIAEEKNQSEIK